MLVAGFLNHGQHQVLILSFSMQILNTKILHFDLPKIHHRRRFELKN